IVCSRVAQNPRFEQRLGHFLHEQRHAIGFDHDLPQEVSRQCLTACHGGGDRLHVTPSWPTWAYSDSTSRDLPTPASPLTRTTCPGRRYYAPSAPAAGPSQRYGPLA